jgi:predicted acetyltransferase
MKLKLEKAQAKDLKAISEIYKEEFSKPPYNEKWTFAFAIKRIKDYSKFCEIWKLRYNNKIIGFTIINTNMWLPKAVCFGEEMAVKSEFQGRGFGTFIIKEIMKIYKKKGFWSVMGIANRKSKTLKLYKKLGIKEDNKNVLISRRLQK